MNNFITGRKGFLSFQRIKNMESQCSAYCNIIGDLLLKLKAIKKTILKFIKKISASVELSFLFQMSPVSFLYIN